MNKELKELKKEIEGLKGSTVYSLWGPSVVDGVELDGDKLNVFLLENGNEPYFVEVRNREDWQNNLNG